MKGPISAGDPIDVKIYRFAGYKNHPAVQSAWLPAFVREVQEGKFLAFVPETGDVRWYPIESEDWRLAR